jgi:hypothetical protein
MRGIKLGVVFKNAHRDIFKRIHNILYYCITIMHDAWSLKCFLRYFQYTLKLY